MESPCTIHQKPQRMDQWDEEREALLELRPPKPQPTEPKLAPPCDLSPEAEYDLAKLKGRPKEEPRRIVVLQNDLDYVARLHEESLCDLDLEDEDDDRPADLTSQFVAMHRDPHLRLTADFCVRHGLLSQWDAFRHPCGETRAEWESLDQYYDRRAKETAWFDTIETALMDPHSDRFWEVLCSRESIDTKRTATRAWIAALAHHTRPVFFIDPKGFSFYGLHWSSCYAAGAIRATAEWKAYQQGLAHEREERRGDRPEHTALQWLKRNAKNALKTRVDQALKARTLLRLEAMDWSWSEFRRQAEERGWV